MATDGEAHFIWTRTSVTTVLSNKPRSPSLRLFGPGLTTPLSGLRWWGTLKKDRGR